MSVMIPANQCDPYELALNAALAASEDIPDDEDRASVEALIAIGKQHLGQLDDRRNAWTALNAVRAILKQYGLIDIALAQTIESALAS